MSWLFAQIPQIYKNYKLKSASGLSIYFLAEWLLGDLCNLLGAIFTNQAAWQVVVAAYYVTVDVCLVGQYVWYVHAKPWRKARLVQYGPHHGGHHSRPEPPQEGISPICNDTSTLATHTNERKGEATLSQPAAPFLRETRSTPLKSFSLNEKDCRSRNEGNLPYHQSFLAPYPRSIALVTLACVALGAASPIQSRTVLLTTTSIATSPHQSTAQLAGRIFSWTSTALYLVSRLPQIYKNLLLRSTSGLSPTLFVAAFFGNLFYSASILANPLAWSSYPPYGLHGWVGEAGSNRETWVGLALPFWLGAAGVLIMDGIIGAQFFVYGENAEMEVLEEGKDGRGVWRQVKGWTRGWVPSLSQESTREVETVQNEERPLMGLGRGDADREHGYGAA